MAALTSQQVVIEWTDNAADRAALFRFSSANAGDTVDLGPSGVAPYFQLCKQAVVMGTTVDGQGAATCSGTTVTMPAGLSDDAGYLLVWGDTN